MFRTESATTLARTHTASAPAELQLAPGDMWHWRPRAALHVQVVSGRAWITLAGEPDDHFLDPGAAIDLPAGCSVWVGAETALQLIAVSGSRSAQPAGQRRPAWRHLWSGWRFALAAARQRLSGGAVQRRGRPIATP